MCESGFFSWGGVVTKQQPTANIFDGVNWLLCKSLSGLGVEGLNQSAASEVRKAVL